MASPTASPSKDSNFVTEDQEPQLQQQQEEPNPPESDNPKSPKSLTLEIPISEDHNPQDPQDDDPNQDDPEDTNPVSPTISDSRLPSSTSVTTTLSISRRGGGQKKKKRNVMKEKNAQKKVDILVGKLKPIPFVPVKTLDFSSHEDLLRRLGLWDFVHVQFDSNIRSDLLAQLIVNYQSNHRKSTVKGYSIKVSRADLARALKLPVKIDKLDSVIEVEESEESRGFVQEFVSTWLLLHEDTWMMTDDILNVTKSINEGHFEKVDWAKLVWIMVEKELAASPKLENCYYASHLQRLMKSQRKELFNIEEPVKMEIDVKDNEDEVDVKLSEEPRPGSEMEEHNIELSLGGLDNAVKEEGETEREEKEQVENEDAMSLGENKEDDELGQSLKKSMDGHFLGRCSLGGEGVMECEEKKQDEEEREEGGKAGEDVEEEAEEEEREEEEEEVGFSLSPKGDTLDGVSSENLIAAMEAAQIPFSSGLQIPDNVSSGDFLASRVDTPTIAGTSSLFGNGNGNKREIDHLENDMPHHMVNNGNKRMRSEEHWDMKASSDFDMCMEQMQHIMGKARMVYEAKEQAFQEMNMNQQVLYSEIQRRNNIVEHLQKAKIEEQQKRQVEIYRLERELYMMGNLLDGYRKALKETHKAFAEYRAKCPLPEEPIYKDTGCGGLVLSTMELEKQRLKQEEEERQNRFLIEKKVKEFEEGWIPKFEEHQDKVEVLGNKLQDIEIEVNLLKENVAKRKVSEIPESVQVQAEELETPKSE